MLGLPAEPVENKKAVPHLRGLIAAVHLPRGLILGCVDVLCLDCLLLPLLSRRPELHPLLITCPSKVGPHQVDVFGDEEQSLPWFCHLRAARHLCEQNTELQLVTPATMTAAPPVTDVTTFERAHMCIHGNRSPLAFWGPIELRISKSVEAGTELLAWPSIPFALICELPILQPENIAGPSYYVCTHCGDVFEYPNELKAHLKLSNCSQPTLSAPTDHAIRSPLGSSSPPPTAAAATDSYSTTSPTIKIPRTVGSTVKHWCSYCGKRYVRKYSLMIHIRTHTGHKPLQCRVCFRRFGDPSNLNKHLRIHADVVLGVKELRLRNPYACKLCDKTLVRRRDLERHMRRKH